MYYIDKRTINKTGEVIDYKEDRECGYITLFVARARFKWLAYTYGIYCPDTINPNEWYTSMWLTPQWTRDQLRITEVAEDE